ncbi:MAG: SDR family oxidoreductase [Myxococcota bacterium]
MKKTLIVGASRGIGLALVKARSKLGDHVFAASRDPGASAELVALADAPRTHDRVTLVPIDVTNEASIASAVARVREQTDDLDHVWNVAGVLHGPDFEPEKRLEHVSPEALARVFAINAFGPILVAKHVAPLLRHDRRAVFAAVSARVGSIGDNRLGGWYAYRASKSALNQLLRTLSIELSRRTPNVIVVSVHPGTVDTDLSHPFQRRVPVHKLFSTGRAADQLIDVIDGLTPEDTGSFRAWDGSPIEW